MTDCGDGRGTQANESGCRSCKSAGVTRLPLRGRLLGCDLEPESRGPSAGCCRQRLGSLARGCRRRRASRSGKRGHRRSGRCGQQRPPSACAPDTIAPGRAPLRRLTRFEYNNTVRELLGDTTNPANALPSEELGNGFGNDADAQSVSSLLAEQYSAVGRSGRRARDRDAGAARQAGALRRRDHRRVRAADETACARTVIEELAPRAYRRPLEPGEADELLALQQLAASGRDLCDQHRRGDRGAAAVARVPVPRRVRRAGSRPRPAACVRAATEMATRLSYLLWGTHARRRAARGRGRTASCRATRACCAQATRLLDDDRARPVLRFFFDNLLPISGLAGLERDRALFPAFTPAIGALMREEIQTFLEREIFEGSGSWRGALTAPYTYLERPARGVLRRARRHGRRVPEGAARHQRGAWACSRRPACWPAPRTRTPRAR